MNLSFKEDHISQIPALMLLEKLGYTYLTPDEALAMRGGKTSNVLLEDVLRSQLRRDDTHEHRQRIDRRVCHGRRVVVCHLVGVCQCRRIGIASRHYTKNRQVVELELGAGNEAHNNLRNHRYKESPEHPHQALSVKHRLGKFLTCAQSH